jgi:hypothetical protein
MIFSSRKKGDNTLHEASERVSKDLSDLNDRLNVFCDKTRNLHENLFHASECLRSVQDRIQKVVSSPYQTLRG